MEKNKKFYLYIYNFDNIKYKNKLKLSNNQFCIIFMEKFIIINAINKIQILKYLNFKFIIVNAINKILFIVFIIKNVFKIVFFSFLFYY